MKNDKAYWDLLDQKPSNVKSEYGSIGEVRFLKPENVRMYDNEGNVVLCKCGKPAGSAAMGKEAFAAWCTDCSPLHNEQAALVYRPPSQEQKKKLDGILSDDWLVNLKPMEDA